MFIRFTFPPSSESIEVCLVTISFTGCGFHLVSKTGSIRNFVVNNWKLSPNDYLRKFGALGTAVQKELANMDLESMKIALLAIQRNLEIFSIIKSEKSIILSRIFSLS
jgi:hypothetical protein